MFGVSMVLEKHEEEKYFCIGMLVEWFLQFKSMHGSFLVFV